VTEDEDGLELTPALDAAILRTLGKIRRGEGVHGAEKVLEEELGRAEKEAERRGVRRREHRTEEKVSRGVVSRDDRVGNWIFISRGFSPREERDGVLRRMQPQSKDVSEDVSGDVSEIVSEAVSQAVFDVLLPA
jgi:hypothetical protein